MEKLLTIVTVCFNSDNTIRKCIESVVSQLTEEVEYLFIDGKSTDKTVEIISEYITENVRLFSEKDNGIYDAMNKGIKFANGKWIWFINSDDFVVPGIVDTILSAVKTFPDVGCIYGDLEYVRLINGKNYSEIKKAPETLSGLKNEMIIYHPSTVCNVDVIRKLGGFDTKYRIAADWDLLLRMYNSGYWMQHINITLSRFYCGGVSAESHIKERHNVRKNNRSYFIIDVYHIKDIIKTCILHSPLGKIISIIKESTLKEVQ